MRELTDVEMSQVDGGNLVMAAAWAITAYSSYQTGANFGDQLNRYNRRTNRMSLGEAIYRTVNGS